MAIDTESRRRSVQAYTLGVMRPAPDGSIGAGDRATAAWVYSGLFDGGSTPPAANQHVWIHIARRRARR